MPELPLLVNTSIALVYALIGGLVARRLGLPTIVGYMIAGVALGPFTPGFHGDEKSIHQLAEFGVILLMFGVRKPGQPELEPWRAIVASLEKQAAS